MIIRRFVAAARLFRDDGWGVTYAIGMMLIVRVALWIVPFRVVHAASLRLKRRHRAALARSADRAGRSASAIARVTRRVRVASRVVPRANCLVQGIVAEALLVAAGHRASLRFGVAGQRGEPLAAHAWVECEGRVVVGGGNGLSDFTPLPHVS